MDSLRRRMRRRIACAQYSYNSLRRRMRRRIVCAQCSYDSLRRRMRRRMRRRIGWAQYFV